MFVLQNTAEVISASAQGCVTLTFIISALVFLNFSLFENFFIIFLRNFICCLCKIYNEDCLRSDIAKPLCVTERFQIVEKVCFFKNVAYSQTLTPNPFPSGRAVYALLALRRAEPLGIHARHPCRGYFAVATAPSPCRGLRPCDPFFKKILVYRQTETALRHRAVSKSYFTISAR